MSYTSYSATPDKDWGPDIRGLEHRVRGLDDRVDDVEREQQETQTRLGDVHDLGYELRRLRESLDTVENTAEDARDELAEHISDTAHELNRLKARLQALEALVRTDPDAPVADLDTVEPAWAELAAAFRAGQLAEAGLLSDHQRQLHTNAIQYHRGAVQQQRDARDRVIAAARTLATTEPGSKGHRAAADEFAKALEADSSAAQRHGNLAMNMVKARAALENDDKRRVEAGPPIEAGRRAELQLTQAMRRRLAAALRDRATLPMWFVTPFGPVPPARGTEKWMNLAVAVLVYRVTHSVTDQVLALGPTPAPTAQHFHQHQDLAQKLRKRS
ncbi:hypothetical protein [Streptomyces ginkgonis]|uniref:hypothetical protein n=1 Tax=Streptomyces ginkgonis TaxID=1812259 RepID=UPI0021769E40|nr:hypothetical protein [Streptomyces ginkgonis]